MINNLKYFLVNYMTIKPVKFLTIKMTNNGTHANWSVDDGTSDPYLNYPYQWNIELTVDPQYHGSPYTRTPYQYDAFDVLIGDWVVTSDDGKAVKIISIDNSTRTGSYVKCVVEDVDRYNTFIDSRATGIGIGQDGFGFLFELSEDGLPLLVPISNGILPNNFQVDLISRFRHRNLYKKYYKVNQPNHSMVVEDMIYLKSDGTYDKANATNSTTANIIGIVKDTYTYSSNHSFDWFSYEPIGEIVMNISPALPGNPGDVIYLSTSGGYTATKPAIISKPIYVRLETASKGIKLNRNVETDDGMHIVENIAARDALPVHPGLQVYVNNIGNGHWGYYVYNGSNYVLVSSQDNITPPQEIEEETHSITLNVNSVSPVTICTVPAHAEVVVVEADVTIEFDDVTSILTIGNDSDNSIHMSDDLNDLSSAFVYEGTHGHQYNVSTDIKAYFNFKSSTVGEVIVTITYS